MELRKYGMQSRATSWQSYLQHEAGVFDAGWSPDGRFVVSGGRDRTARVWEALTGQLLIPQLDAGGTAIRTIFSPGRQVLVVTLDRALLWGLWPRGGLRTDPILTDGSVTVSSISPDGS